MIPIAFLLIERSGWVSLRTLNIEDFRLKSFFLCFAILKIMFKNQSRSMTFTGKCLATTFKKAYPIVFSELSNYFSQN
jgi:hypothetical protein